MTLRHPLFAAVALVAGGTLAAAAPSSPTTAGDDVPTYTNAEVVSVDTSARTMVVKDTDGNSKTVELDDNVAGFGDVAAGDKVIVSLRQTPGRPRVTAFVKSNASLSTSGTVAVSAPPATKYEPGSAVIVDEPAALRASFSLQVANLADLANRVDRLWSQFVTTCHATTTAKYDGARPWLAIWDRNLSADLSSGFCRDLRNQIVGLGSTVNAGMAEAEETARRGLAPGTIRETERRYAMDWSGWGAPAPDPITP